MQQEKPMPNAIIAAGMAIIIGNAHLHHRQDSEVEDMAAVNGIIEDDVDGEEEDVGGGITRSPRKSSACCSDRIRIRQACT